MKKAMSCLGLAALMAAIIGASFGASMVFCDLVVDRALDKAEARMLKAVPKMVDAAVQHMNGLVPTSAGCDCCGGGQCLCGPDCGCGVR